MNKSIKTLYRPYSNGKEPKAIVKWRIEQRLSSSYSAAIELFFVEVYELVFYLYKSRDGAHEQTPHGILDTYIKLVEKSPIDEDWKINLLNFLSANFEWQ